MSRIEELERENAQQRQLIEKLRERILELERVIEELRRSGKRQAAPFSKGQPARNPRTPGRKAGKHYGRRKARPVPSRVDETHEAPLPCRCPECGASDVRREGVEDQYQTDLPEPRVVVRRFRVHVGECRQCGSRVQGRHPLQTSDALGAAANQIGPRAVSLGAQMNKELGLSWEKVAGILTTLGLEVSRSGLCRAAERLGQKAAPTYEKLKGSIPWAAVVTPDETGWRVGGMPAWLWAFVTEDVTLYAIREGRGWDEAADVLGEDFPGVLVRDGWAAYRRFVEATHQSCLAHLLCRCEELEESTSRTVAEFAGSVKRSFEKGFWLREQWEKGTISYHGLQVARGRLEASLDRLLQEESRQPDKRRFAKHLRREQPALFTFLRLPGVPATNWRAEQAIRPAVVNRKVWGGNRTWSGARTQEVLSTVIRTHRQQGRDPLAGLIDLLHSPRRKVLRLVPPVHAPPS